MNFKIDGLKTASGIIPLPGNDVQKALKTADGIQNLAKGFSTETDPMRQTGFANNSLNKQYSTLAAAYEYWIPRKVVDIIPEEATRKGWSHVCPSMTPEQVKELEKWDMKFKVREHMRRAWRWDRLFGGSLVTFIFDQSMGLYRDPITPGTVREGALKAIDVYDPWQAYAANVEFHNLSDENFRKPTKYTLGVPGYMVASKAGISEGERSAGTHIGAEFIDAAIIHVSRTVRWEGLPLPWYSYIQNFYWGQSLLASVMDAVKQADVAVQAVAQLLFRLSVPVFKVKDLTDIISDEIATGAFLQRMRLLNTTMSNNHMSIIDVEEELTNLEQSGIAGVESLIERFFKILSCAANIPVSKFTGEQEGGLGNGGDENENNFAATIDAERQDKLLPALNEFYDIFFPAVMGMERPDDHRIEFPPIHNIDPLKECEVGQAKVNLLSNLLLDGAIDMELYIKELQEYGILKNLDEVAAKRILASFIADRERDEFDEDEEREAIYNSGKEEDNEDKATKKTKEAPGDDASKRG